jgi:hypothetical protein
MACGWCPPADTSRRSAVMEAHSIAGRPPHCLHPTPSSKQAPKDAAVLPKANLTMADYRLRLVLCGAAGLQSILA